MAGEFVEEPSWEGIARRVWGARRKIAGFVAIVVATDVAGIWLGTDENATVMVGAVVSVLLLAPDPPLWRMPLRSHSARRADHEPLANAHEPREC